MSRNIQVHTAVFKTRIIFNLDTIYSISAVGFCVGQQLDQRLHAIKQTCVPTNNRNFFGADAEAVRFGICGISTNRSELDNRSCRIIALRVVLKVLQIPVQKNNCPVIFQSGLHNASFMQ